MKIILLLALSIATIGCSSSSGDSENIGSPLLGTWLSNCHEFLGTEGEAGNTLYNVSEITFTGSEYVDNFVSYTDINCTTNPIEESSTFNYTIGDVISTTDGVSATRITLTGIIPDRPELSTTLEAIFRISNVDLNFGEYNEGEIPVIDTRVTYTKQ